MAPHATAPLPVVGDDWQEWFLENTRSFLRALLMRRDGARLHGGLAPTADLDRIVAKLMFLIQAGVPERHAQFAMLASSRFTVGSVLEEQAEAQGDSMSNESLSTDTVAPPSMGHALAFEEGLRLIVEGLVGRVADGTP